MAFIIFGDSLLDMIGLHNPPKWVLDAKENKMAVFITIFFINNFFSSKLSTGAFEITYNDELVYSKLETHRMPTVQDVLSGVEEARKMFWAAQSQIEA